MDFSSRARKRIREAKKRARPGNRNFENFKWKLITHWIFEWSNWFVELSSSSSWEEQNYYKTFENYTRVQDNVERISVDEVSPAEFISRYEKPYLPVVILDTQKEWMANYKWSLQVSISIIVLISSQLPPWILTETWQEIPQSEIQVRGR